MVSALDFQSLILSSIPGGNRSFLLSLHPLRLSHRIINFSTIIVIQLTSSHSSFRPSPPHIALYLKSVCVGRKVNFSNG